MTDEELDALVAELRLRVVDSFGARNASLVSRLLAAVEALRVERDEAQDRERLCFNHQSANAKTRLCRECLDHAIETGAFI